MCSSSLLFSGADILDKARNSSVSDSSEWQCCCSLFVVALIEPARLMKRPFVCLVLIRDSLNCSRKTRKIFRTSECRWRGFSLCRSSRWGALRQYMMRTLAVYGLRRALPTKTRSSHSVLCFVCSGGSASITDELQWPLCLFLSQSNPFRRRICHVFSTSEHKDGSLTFEDFLDLLSAFSDSATLEIKSHYAFRIFGKY